MRGTHRRHRPVGEDRGAADPRLAHFSPPDRARGDHRIVTTLADRIRGVLQTPAGQRPAPHHQDHAPLPRQSPSGAGADEITLESVLGGEWRRHAGAACFIVDCRRDRTHVHGRETVGVLADRLAESVDHTALLTELPVRAPLLFFDLETTGLSGGAGTYPFLIGCGWFDD